MAAATGEGVPRLAHLGDQGRTDRRDVWRDLLREHFVSLDVDVDRDGGAFGAAVHSGFLGHLRVSAVRSVDQDIIRTEELLRGDRENYFQVCLVRRGEALACQDGHEATLRPGDFVVYETERPFHWRLHSAPQSPYWEIAVFTWPRDTILLPASESARLTCRTLDGGTGLTGVLSRMLTDLLTARPEVSETGGIQLADEVGELVATVSTEVYGRAEEPGHHAGLLRRIDAYLDEHLADPELSPTRIAQAHFLSTRQLQRMFARRGQTVSEVIRHRRLERCRRDLLARGGGSTLTEMCLRWGFSDLAVFSRAFREAYGASPTAYRAARPR